MCAGATHAVTCHGRSMKQQKIIIGICGGVGSGKSTVVDLLEKNYAATVIKADEVGHLAFEPGSETYKKIITHFGDDILNETKEIDHGKLADRVFSDSSEKEFIDSVVHPFALDYIRERIKVWRKTDGRLFVIETALMFETGCDKLCDEVWLVTADESVRVERLKTTRGYTEEKSRSIIAAQINDEKISANCKKIIMNNGSKKELETDIIDAVNARCSS